MYTCQCDGCGKKFESDEFSAFTEPDGFLEWIEDHGWHIGDGTEGEDGKHYCPNYWEYDEEDKFFVKG